MHSYDVIVVGGGVVGMTTALALAEKTPLQIALIDTKDLSQDWCAEKYDYRVSAISLASQRIFQKLSVWNAIQAKRISPYHKMHVWDANGNGEVRFDAEDIRASELGYIIEDSVMRSSLLERLVSIANVHLLAPLKLHSLQEQADCIVLTADDGRVLQARLVVAADGGDSWVRSQAGIGLKSWDYQHQAIVATVRTTLPHQCAARQRFLSTGPLAFLPLVDAHFCSIVWSTSPAQAEQLLLLDDSAFQTALTGAFDYQLGEVTAVSPRHSFALTMRHAKQYVRSRLALVGDAAHTIHPLAGLGVNMGLLDAACLADVIVDALAKERDFTSLSTLRRYERWRKSDNAAMLAFVESIKYLFASEASAIKSLRNVGLGMTNQIDWLKQFFANYAAGNRGDMPALAR